MVSLIAKQLGLSSTKFQSIENLIKAIGLPKCKVCTYCWDAQG